VATNRGPAFLIQLGTDLVLLRLIYYADRALEGAPHGSVIGKLQWRRVVVYLSQVVTPGHNAVAPSRYTSFFRAVVIVCTKIVLVRGQKDRCSLSVMRKCLTMDHLNVKLVILIERTKITPLNKLSRSIVVHPNAVIEIAKPDDSIMVVDSSVSLEM